MYFSFLLRKAKVIVGKVKLFLAGQLQKGDIFHIAVQFLQLGRDVGCL